MPSALYLRLDLNQSGFEIMGIHPLELLPVFAYLFCSQDPCVYLKVFADPLDMQKMFMDPSLLNKVFYF